MTWGRVFLDLLFPCCCPGCGKKTDDAAPWCEDCIRLFWHPRLISTSHDKYLEGCYTCCQYKEGLRKSLLALKYKKNRGREGTYAMLLARFPWWERLVGCTMAVPVPLGEEHRKKRGYNQCDIIFQRFLEERGLPYRADYLLRHRNTRTQSSLSLPERKDNVKYAFHCAPGLSLTGERVLLVDDIYTTGSTMKEAAKELRRRGAASVIGLTLASGAL